MIKTLILGLLLPILAWGKDYKFTEGWFHPAIQQNWKIHFSSLSSKPINYLEVGVWEGRSFFWVLENVALHPASTLTAIDTFYDKRATENFHKNVKLSQVENKIHIIKGPSQKELKKLRDYTYDIIYIDGSHRSRDVITDGVLAWDLLKDGGTLIFDDYDTEFAGKYPVQYETWPAIDSFVQFFDGEIQKLERKNDQVLITKKLNSYIGIHFCGGVYDFESFIFTKNKKTKRLNQKDNSTLVNLLDKKPYGISTSEFMNNINEPQFRKFVTDEFRQIQKQLCE